MLSKMLIAACLIVGASAQWGTGGNNNGAAKTGEKHEHGRECFDGKDNDGDGTSDCNDSDCQRDPRIRQRCQRMKAYEERHDGKSHESGKQCFDGIDNDGDGEKDCEDPDCQIMPRATSAARSSPSATRSSTGAPTSRSRRAASTGSTAATPASART